MTSAEGKPTYRNPFEGRSGVITLTNVRNAGFVEQQFDASGVKLNHIVGPDNGPPLVLVPAQYGTWESYQRVLVPLSKNFQVYAIDIRGHGKSTWTPGDYSWESIGRDMRQFLSGVVRRPAIVSGNSSGGIIALWCAANLPAQVGGAVLEDAPVFLAEMPRFKEQDPYAYNALKHTADSIGDPTNRDLANFFRGLEVVRSPGKTRRIPDWFVDFLSGRIRKFEAAHPGEPVDIRWFPLLLRLTIKSLSMFDPDFARAFVDGRFYEGIDHAEALSKVTCPLMVLHGDDWFRDPEHGLIGAMDSDDVARIRQLVPRVQYHEVAHPRHVIHFWKPKVFVRLVEQFARTVPTAADQLGHG